MRQPASLTTGVQNASSTGDQSAPVLDDDLPEAETCDLCGGSADCPQCDGTGLEDGKIAGEPCGLCLGSGTCPECHGSGTI